MTLHATRRATNVACALTARVAACALALMALDARGQGANEPLADEPPAVEAPADDAGPALMEKEQPAFMAPTAPDAPEFARPLAESLTAPLDDWQQPLEGDTTVAGNVPVEDKPPLRPFDWIHHWGFHHSSTEGRFLDRGLPMERSSWLNRPYHVDWFAGPLLSTGPVDGRVEQGNDLFGGLRIGWDFDYYWGVEWRFGWSDPTLLATVTGADGDSIASQFSGNYFVSDVDFVYYPWGDTKVRPYALFGLGMAQVGSVRADGTGQEATLLGMPMGIGVHFPQTHWLTWRLEIIDNLAWGAEGVDTLNNFAFTAGMELRLGARPNSYWPWRSSRTIW